MSSLIDLDNRVKEALSKGGSLWKDTLEVYFGVNLEVYTGVKPHASLGRIRRSLKRLVNSGEVETETWARNSYVWRVKQ